MHADKTGVTAYHSVYKGLQIRRSTTSLTHGKIKMAMQVKHMVTFGLGLGIATAFGYHFLSSPQNNAAKVGTPQVIPLNRFEIAQAPALTASTPAPAQLQLDDHFRVEAQPLQSAAVRVVPPVQPQTPQVSYSDLVAAMPATLPPAAEPVEPLEQAQTTVEIDEADDSFSLDLNVPSDSEPEFVFDDVELDTLQADVEPTENSLALEEMPVAADEVLELDTAADDLADESTFTANLAQAVPTQNQDESLTVVVDYNSQALDRSADTAESTTPRSKKIAWKSNPFIDSTPAKDKVDTPNVGEYSAPEADPTPELRQVSALQEQPATRIQSVEPIQTNSVLSLIDPAREEYVVAAKPTRAVLAAATPDTNQPYQRQDLTNDQVSTRPVQIAPQTQLALSNADAHKAVHHIEYGKTLSRRGAAFTARQEFLAAMQVIAASNDKASGDHRHSKALRTAMMTIKEAKDFAVANSEQQIYMDVASVVESHRSQVLTQLQAANLSPVQAMNRYFAHAQEQLDLAGGRNAVSAEVFYCMGKLHTMLNRNQKVLGPYATAQSVVYHQAALLSDNQHHRSSNELGVLLARSGRLEQSKMLFERSLMSQPTVRTWQNLAETHRRLGETEFANQAAGEVQMLANGITPAVHSNIQWKPIEVFNADAPVEFNEQRVAQLPQPPVVKPSPSPAKSNPAKSIADRIKGIF